MLYKYEAKTPDGESRTGTIDAPNKDIAASSLQKRGLIVVSVLSAEERSSIFQKNIAFFERIKEKDIVVLSRQLATLFEAKVPVMDSLRIISSEVANEKLRKHLSELTEDIQGGLSISQAFSKHPEVFSVFYVNMVRAGEEAGKLEETFTNLADHLEQSYELSSKAKNALVYPAFVLTVFFAVISVVFVVVIPRLSGLLLASGVEIPIYTKILIGIGNFLRTFGVFILALIAAGVVFLWRYWHTSAGNLAFSRLQLTFPVIGDLYRKIYLARFSGNLQTLLSGGVNVIRALEISAEVVGNAVYKKIINGVTDSVKSGSSISESLVRYEDVPRLIVQMMRIGEETGKLNSILTSLSKFYTREVANSVERMISLIEPILIVSLGLGVGFIMASVLLPIYNITSGF